MHGVTTFVLACLVLPASLAFATGCGFKDLVAFDINAPEHRSLQEFLLLNSGTRRFISGDSINDYFADLSLNHLPIPKQSFLLTDVKEIKIRQEVFRELLSHPTLLHELEVWVQERPRSWSDQESGVFNGASLSAKDRDKILANSKGVIDIYNHGSKLISILDQSSSPRLRDLGHLAYEVFGGKPNGFKTIVDELKGLSDPDEIFSKLQDKVLYPIANENSDESIYQGRQVGHGIADIVKLAQFARTKQWKTFPEIIDPLESGGPVLKFNEGVHSLVQDQKKEAAVLNSMSLSIKDGHQGLIIRGANDQGKSTYVITPAELLYLGQQGLPLPVSSARFTPMQFAYYTSRNVKGSTALGSSGFVAEASSAHNFFYTLQAHNQQHPNVPMLVILDEIMRGSLDHSRSAAEMTFITKIAKLNTLILSVTHNVGTSMLEHEDPRFTNIHFKGYRRFEGTPVDESGLIDDNSAALRKGGWPKDWTTEFETRARKLAGEKP